MLAPSSPSTAAGGDTRPVAGLGGEGEDLEWACTSLGQSLGVFQEGTAWMEASSLNLESNHKISLVSQVFHSRGQQPCRGQG